MAKDPAFLFYPNDWIGGTMGMTFEEKGAYMDVLMMQFNRGHMTLDMIGHVIGHTKGQVLDKILSKLKKDQDGLYYNERLEIEKNKRKSFVDSRLNNKLGVNKYNKKAGHMTSHMEDVNINLTKDALIPNMVEVFKKHNEGYFVDEGRDFTACREIAIKIGEINKWSEVDVLGKQMKGVLKYWSEVVNFTSHDAFLKNMAIQNLNNQWQMVMKKFNVTSSGKNKMVF